MEKSVNTEIKLRMNFSQEKLTYFSEDLKDCNSPGYTTGKSSGEHTFVFSTC